MLFAGQHFEHVTVELKMCVIGRDLQFVGYSTLDIYNINAFSEMRSDRILHVIVGTQPPHLSLPSVRHGLGEFIAGTLLASHAPDLLMSFGRE
jgi:hypothetical protein